MNQPHILASLIFTGVLVTGVTQVIAQNSGASGQLSLVANGEDFVRQGFVTKDGWQIQFDHVYVTLDNVYGYQTSPPFEPGKGGEIKAQETVNFLDTPTTVDLASGEADAPPILVTTVDAPPGSYNALSWQLTPASRGEAAGNTIVLIGAASKNNQTIDFMIKLDQPLKYVCGEFVGDERKGILIPGNTAELETTFHFDHIFGDGEAPADDAINTGAVGFAPMAALAENGNLEVDMTTLKANLNPQDYQTLSKAIAGLGHVGEGHCELISE